jgi:hypothetical protein
LDEQNDLSTPNDPERDEFPPQTTGSGAITIPLLCAGVALIAACVLIPAADENRRLVYERERLKQDLEQIQHQVAVNDQFLAKVADDPNLAERLAQRQMKVVREGTRVLELRGSRTSRDNASSSPFLLVTVPPPAPMPPYQPLGGSLAHYCLNPKTQLYLIGAGLLLMACGLVLGASNRVEC